MSETAKIFEVGSEQYIDLATYERLQAELTSARAENEKLMNVEYWPERARNAEKRVAELEAAYDCLDKWHHANGIHTTMRENLALRAEVERLQKLCTERSNHSLELQLRAEKLVEALEKIINHPLRTGSLTDIATAALRAFNQPSEKEHTK